MDTSKQGLLSLIREEGIVLSTYYDSVGVATIGIGHTAAAGGLVPKPGMTLTLKEAIDLFKKDIEKYEAGVENAVKVALSQNEFDALTSFNYNTGAIKTGTVDDKLNVKNTAEAIKTLLQYTNKGNPGLVARRKREADMFAYGIYNTDPIAVYDRYPGPARSVSQKDIPLDVPGGNIGPSGTYTKEKYTLWDFLVSLFYLIFGSKR